MPYGSAYIDTITSSGNLTLSGNVSLSTIKSTTSIPPTIQNTSGTEIGTFCRAWVNFNGTGTVAIRASFNVSSITDNGTGTYVVNMTTAMSDINYAVAMSGRFLAGAAGTTAGGLCALDTTIALTTTTIPIITVTKDTTTRVDNPDVSVAVFR